MEKQRFEFFIYPQEVDYTKRMTLTALGSCLLNAAGLAAAEKGFGKDAILDYIEQINQEVENV